MAATHLGGKVLVLTVDPAKRLANALGLEQFGNVETRVPDEAFAEAGVEPRGELWAAMLDTKQSWDDLIGRHAPDAATRDAILANPLYQNITGKFVQSHDYIAMERLYEIHTSGRYDLIVVDTPPTRNAIDFLDAPERMADFFSSPAAALAHRAVPVAGRRRRVEALLPGRRPDPRHAVPRGHRRVLHPLPDDVRRVRRAGQGGDDAARRRPDVVRGRVHARGRAAREAEFFLELLDRRDFHLGALVLNKVLPDSSSMPPPPTSARLMAERNRPTWPPRSPRSSVAPPPTPITWRTCSPRSARASSTTRSWPAGRRSSAPSWRRSPN